MSGWAGLKLYRLTKKTQLSINAKLCYREFGLIIITFCFLYISYQEFRLF